MNLLRRLIGWIEAFLVQAPPLYVGIGLIVAAVLGFEGMVTYNQMNLFCLKCHEPMGIYRSFNEDLVAHAPFKKDRENCLVCHTDKNFYTFFTGLVAELPGDFVHVTNNTLPILPVADKDYDDEQCLACHNDSLKIDQSDKLRLPPKLAEIGLVFSHQRHYWVKTYPGEAAQRLAQLQTVADLPEKEKNEYEFLLRARMGYCAQCHDQRRVVNEGQPAVNRDINYFSINPMHCTGCHLDATPGRHPGTIHLELPREETCRRCHTGTFHGRFTVFRAECAGLDKRDCKRCHPDYSEVKFEFPSGPLMPGLEEDVAD